MANRGLVVGITLSVFAIAFETIGIAAALPTIMGSFDANHLYPWAFTTAVSGMLVTTVIAGQVADRRGPALLFYAGFAAFGVGLLLGALAPTVWVLLLSRVVQGVGAGALNLTLSFIVAHGFDATARPKVIALLSFCWVLPAFIGPPVAAWLTKVDWRLVFVIMIPLAGAALLISRPGVRSVQRTVNPADDTGPIAGWPLAALTLAPSLILLTGQDLPVWARAGCAVLGVVSLMWSLPRVLAPGTVGVGPGIPSVVATRALQAGSFFAAEAILLVVLQNLRGLTVVEVGTALTVGSVGWSVGAWIQSRPWLSRTGFIVLGTCLNVSSIVFLTVFAWQAWIPLAAGLVGWVVASLGMGLSMASCALAVMVLSGSSEQGRNQSSLHVAEGVGTALFTAVAGGLYTALLGADPEKLSYTVALAALVVVAFGAVVMGRRIGPVPENASGQ